MKKDPENFNPSFKPDIAASQQKYEQMVQKHRATEGKEGYAQKHIRRPSTPELQAPAKLKYGYTPDYREKIEKYHREKFDSNLLEDKMKKVLKR